MPVDFTRAVISIGLLAIARRLVGVVTCACALLTLPAAETRSQQRSPSVASSRPNVILIMTDDMGYADLGSYGGKDIKTPILDRLASDGVSLTDAYANRAPGAPTRACRKLYIAAATVEERRLSDRVDRQVASGRHGDGRGKERWSTCTRVR